MSADGINVRMWYVLVPYKTLPDTFVCGGYDVPINVPGCLIYGHTIVMCSYRIEHMRVDTLYLWCVTAALEPPNAIFKSAYCDCLDVRHPDFSALQSPQWTCASVQRTVSTSSQIYDGEVCNDTNKRISGCRTTLMVKTMSYRCAHSRWMNVQPLETPIMGR